MTISNGDAGTDSSQGYLPRCRAVEQIVFRQDQWASLGVHDAVGADPVGAERVGVALLDRAGALGALLSGAASPTKLLTDWARQMIIQVRTWLPDRMLVVVADSSYAALELLAACRGCCTQ